MKNTFITIIYIIVLFISCNQKNNCNDLNVNNKDTIVKDNFVYNQYLIPLPIDLFKFIENKENFNPILLNLTNNTEKYFSEKQKSFNLGVYTADLAYSLILSNAQSVINCSNSASYLSNQLNIEDTYGKPYIIRLEKNIDNTDSLKFITNEAYKKTCIYLDQKGKKNILPFVIYGGWIESLYLIVNISTDKISEQELYIQILKNKSGINNIIDYLYDVQVETSAYYYYNDFKEIITELTNLSKLFSTLEKEQTKSNFVELKKSVDKLRNNIIK